VDAALAHQVGADAIRSRLDADRGAAPAGADHQRDQFIDVREPALLQQTFDELPVAERLVSDAVVGRPIHLQLAAQDLFAQIDHVLVMLRERIVDEAEMTTPVVARIECEIVHHPIHVPVAELLPRHLIGGAERAVVRTPADERHRPVLRTRGSVRAAIEALLPAFIRCELIAKEMAIVERVEIDESRRLAAHGVRLRVAKVDARNLAGTRPTPSPRRFRLSDRRRRCVRS
jgi:hypothetical protein